eukprot:CAMPEP_0115666586 /NCGR_PEP_ID=MMETSP0272-20121206/49492_1 /TAXON_ID=71861 /ORGANISM="Scrippsiella trochoidea, Strain CCMP3099" /LENGTH=77 /DNA_ID=CAMNT_0003105089 /DNA_START=52 /DNA_END=285 /DNA_ORIENTATION=+
MSIFLYALAQLSKKRSLVLIERMKLLMYGGRMRYINTYQITAWMPAKANCTSSLGAAKSKSWIVTEAKPNILKAERC